VKVLVVDDVAANRKVLRALLQRVGHEVCVAADAATARRSFEIERPQIVLTDLHLENGEDGFTVAESLRVLPGGDRVRIVLLTGDPVVTAERTELVDAVLQKPVSLDDITNFLGEKAT